MQYSDQRVQMYNCTSAATPDYGHFTTETVYMNGRYPKFPSKIKKPESCDANKGLLVILIRLNSTRTVTKSQAPWSQLYSVYVV